MRTHVHIIDERPPGVTVRAFRSMQRAAMYAAGIYWDRNYKMLRFRPGGPARYRLHRRSSKYLARIRRLLASTAGNTLDRDAERPLVYSGLTQRSVDIRLIPRVFPTRFTITLPTPRYINFRRKPSNPGPPLGEEVTRATGEESDMLATVARDEWESQNDSLHQPTRVT